jgi:hypothetical protein
MKNTVSVHKIQGVNVVKLRTRMPCEKTHRDFNRYSRKVKHQGRQEW